MCADSVAGPSNQPGISKFLARVQKVLNPLCYKDVPYYCNSKCKLIDLLISKTLIH